MEIVLPHVGDAARYELPGVAESAAHFDGNIALIARVAQGFSKTGMIGTRGSWRGKTGIAHMEVLHMRAVPIQDGREVFAGTEQRLRIEVQLKVRMPHHLDQTRTFVAGRDEIGFIWSQGLNANGHAQGLAAGRSGMKSIYCPSQAFVVITAVPYPVSWRPEYEQPPFEVAAKSGEINEILYGQIEPILILE